jgi:MoaA/NifB/PqqE/SkfB family radical SAM enzyme
MMEKKSLFEAFETDIVKLYKTPEEIERVKKIFEKAESQTKRKEIPKPETKPNRLKKFVIHWKIRFKYGIHWRKKFFLFRVMRNYSLSFLYRLFHKNRHVFRGIEFDLTFKCNMKCHHCLCAELDESDERKELEPDEYERVVKEAMKLGAHTFGLEGGEPFMAKNWEAILQRMKPFTNHIIISSNGLMLDEKLVKKCAESGVDTINLSLDSGIPELHDVFRRRKGSFEKVKTAIALCKKYKIKVMLNTCLHKGNIYTEGLLRLLELAEREKLLVNILFAKGVGAFREKDSMLSDEDIQSFLKIAEPYNYWHIHHMGKLKSNHGGEGCSGSKEFVNITPYGDVINCANNHIYIGNVRKESFAAIRERALRELPFGKYRPCFLTMDQDFMNIYYPLLEKKNWISCEEFHVALRDYEKKNNRIIYPEISPKQEKSK